MMFGLAVVCPGNSERFKTKLINNQNLPAIQATGQDITFCNIFSCFLEQMVIQFCHPNSSKMGIGTLCLTFWYLHKTFTWYINRLHLQPQLANVQLRSIHVNNNTHPQSHSQSCAWNNRRHMVGAKIKYQRTLQQWRTTAEVEPHHCQQHHRSRRCKCCGCWHHMQSIHCPACSTWRQRTDSPWRIAGSLPLCSHWSDSGRQQCHSPPCKITAQTNGEKDI